jgi:cell volume regulation protein A
MNDAMSTVSLFLLTVAAIILIGIVGELVFEKTGIPDVAWLILVGILLGPVSGLIDRSQLTSIAPYFGALTLVIVLFDGGSELRLGELSRAAPRGGTVAVLGFLASVAVIAPASMLARWIGVLPESWSWMHSVMLGTIVGGPSSVVIMPALRKAGLGAQLSNMLNVDSAITDVLSVVLTGALINLMLSGSTSFTSALGALGQSFGIGLGIGLAAGMLSLFVLRRLKRSNYAYPLLLGTLLLLYVVISEAGGSAALGILTVAVLVGNAPAISKAVGLARTASLGRGVAGVHDQVAFFIKSFFFTFIGAMLGPPWGLVLLGVVFGALLLASRIPAVLASTMGGGFSQPERGLLSISLPRGMAAGVLAMLPAQYQVPGTEQLPVVVFATVVTTIALFTVGFPIMKRRLAAVGAPAQATPPAPVEAPADPVPDSAADEAEAAAPTPEPAAAADEPAASEAGSTEASPVQETAAGAEPAQGAMAGTAPSQETTGSAPSQDAAAGATPVQVEVAEDPGANDTEPAASVVGK